MARFTFTEAQQRVLIGLDYTSNITIRNHSSTAAQVDSICFENILSTRFR